MLLSHNLKLTSWFSVDFEACEFVSEECFERFFFRLLFFSSQLIATNSWAREVFTFEDVYNLFDSLEKQSFVLSGRQQNKTEDHHFSTFSESTHQNGALKIPGMPIDLDYKVMQGIMGAHDHLRVTGKGLAGEGRGRGQITIKFKFSQKFNFTDCRLFAFRGNYLFANLDFRQPQA